MKTKLLRKLRKKAKKRVKLFACYPPIESNYRVQYNSNRARYFMLAEDAYEFHTMKRRQYILNQIRWIRTKSITFPR